MSINKLCRALANEDRVKLLVCLSQEKSVSELLDYCHLSQSALSQHLKILRDAKVVETHKSGKYILYKVSDKKVTNIAKLLLNYK